MPASPQPCVAAADNNVDIEPDEFSRELGQALGASVCPAILDRDGAPFNPAKFVEPLHKSSGPRCPGRRRRRPQIADGRQLARLLRPRRERPRRRRAAEQRDELAPRYHSITSSASARSLSGTARPSALAVLRLITSSNF